MREAGMDVGIFKAHSTWGGASSAAKDKRGFYPRNPTNGILNEGMSFNLFYYRPKYSNSLGNAALHCESLL